MNTNVTDKTFWWGLSGFFGSITLEHWNSVASLSVAILTCIYLLIKIRQLLRNKGH